jgi:hypothetical protein
MSQNIENVIKLLGVSLAPDSHAYKTLLMIDDFGLLNPKHLEINNSLYSCIERICVDDYFNSLLQLAEAVPEEFNFMTCLALEGFSTWGNLLSGLIDRETIEIKKTRQIFESKYSDSINFGIFKYKELYDFKEQDYEPRNMPRLLLKILHHHCGNSEQFIQSFYDVPFQKFLDILSAYILFWNDKNSVNFLKALDYYSSLEFQSSTLSIENDFNAFFNDCFQKYFELIRELFKQFSYLRMLTISVIESHLQVIINDKYIKIKSVDLSIFSLKELNALLNNLLAKTECKLEPDVKGKIIEYLNKDYSMLKKEGGFINVIINQHNLALKLKKFQEGTVEPKPIGEAQEKELLEASEEYSNILDNIAVISRLNYILSNVEGNLGEDEKVGFWEKVAGIISSKSTTFYNDIFELYVYTILKLNHVPIKLLNSQVEDGKDKSTCDYKIGNDIAADCKCIISNNAGFNQLSEHCTKIGKQILSTIGYENILFGGGIIGYRDRNFEFLRPFSVYKDDEDSKISILNFIINSYSEFRRHTDKKSQEQIKFILIYYLPNSKITPEVILNAKPETVEVLNEIFFLFTTKYASSDEVQIINDTFKSVIPMTFKFNNSFGN